MEKQKNKLTWAETTPGPQNLSSLIPSPAYQRHHLGRNPSRDRGPTNGPTGPVCLHQHRTLSLFLSPTGGTYLSAFSPTSASSADRSALPLPYTTARLTPRQRKPWSLPEPALRTPMTPHSPHPRPGAVRFSSRQPRTRIPRITGRPLNPGAQALGAPLFNPRPHCSDAPQALGPLPPTVATKEKKKWRRGKGRAEAEEEEHRRRSRLRRNS